MPVFKEIFMILEVKNLSHGFGDRAIFENVSFRLLKGEHIGLIGANGEGKSTFMNIVTGKLMPDEGKVEWAKNVRADSRSQFQFKVAFSHKLIRQWHRRMRMFSHIVRAHFLGYAVQIAQPRAVVF